ncbi:glutathione peroxidase [Oleiphilus sp. HI0071]|uniref:glutathione peroxidase n=1 Tax=Oleiphilus sp. HI0080 TaxID=1822255 RepID=UPI0007C2D294|nr:glutathione peroxidase [Oleiphilus sp. HI0080]KZY68596.1 glutathione peroxidase [Oleiphilus sp. HI0065]KZY82857.1 glutathione peroxidase [Oleiphilus sp. HI0071]KZZ04831.1 glutathione peroxidase [Oleiphilus sp. HI0073]KZZ49163.1 glutathione peroxidase [Oleiphilus sp. HI0122]KZY72564.1 glutathione peroxidase [Oleiphilus sp. HI0065]
MLKTAALFAHPLRSLALTLSLSLSFTADALAECAQWLDHKVAKLHSQETLNLCALTENKTVLFVNTASKCGFTPQFKELQALYERYQDQNFTIIGFPSNSFRQAARDEGEAAEVCYVNFGVKFPMTSTTSVRGTNAHPVFQHLAAESEAPQWNFNKYLVSSSGEVIEHFGSSVSPTSRQLTQAIESAL